MASEKDNHSCTLDKIISLCKRRGFVYQSSEIYGGQAGAWDYGPLGVDLKKNIQAAWWKEMTQLHDDVVALYAMAVALKSCVTLLVFVSIFCTNGFST